MFRFFSRNPKTDPEPDPVALAMIQKLDQLTTMLAPDPDLKETSGSLGQLKNQVDELEMRFETLKTQCLRHLQSASQRLKRAQELEEIDEPEENRPAAELPAELQNQEAEEQSDFAWAEQQLRAQGIQPIAG